MNINERENDSQNGYVRISILDNDVCMIMKQNENDEVSKCQKWNKYYPSQHDVSPAYGFFKCQEKSPIHTRRILMILRVEISCQVCVTKNRT